MDLETLKQGSETLYEHGDFIVLAPKTAAANGHVIVMPQREAKNIDELTPETFSELCMIANYVSAILFETLQAHGTNIIVVEEEPRLRFEIIARKEGDGLDLLWTPRPLQQNELDEVSERLRDKTFMIGKEDESASPSPEPEPAPAVPAPSAAALPPATPAPQPVPDAGPAALSEEELKAEEEKENYLIRQLRRVP